MGKVIIVVDGNEIAPRFDLALELLIVSLGKGGKPAEKGRGAGAAIGRGTVPRG